MKLRSTNAIGTWLAIFAVVAAAACGDDEVGAGSGGSSGRSTAAGAPSGAGGESAGEGGAAASTTSTAATSSSAGSSSGGGGSGGSGPSASSSGTGGGAPATFLDVYPLAAQFPEGGTYDAGEHAFFVGSLADGSVHRIDAATGTSEVFFSPSEVGAWWTLGMAVDEARRRLWVCAMDDRREQEEDPPYDGYVWAFDLVTGEREAVFTLADAASEATCTDVAVAADGTVFVTDRDFGFIYQVDIDEGPTVFTSDADLEASLIGQNAAVVLPDQSALLVALYLPSRLVRVDLVDRTVRDVEIDGSFADAAFLAGADGMTYADGNLYVAFTSELVRLTPTLADWSSATAEEVDVTNGMTDVVATPDGLFLLNGQAVRYATGEAPDPFTLTRFTGSF